MKGIFYSEFLLGAFLLLLILAGVVDMIITIREETKEPKEKGKNTLKDTVQCIVMIAVNIIVIVGGIYVTLKYKIRWILIPFSIVAILYSFIVFATSIFDSVKFIFFKLADYELTGKLKHSLYATGIVVLYIGALLAQDNIGIKLDNYMMTLDLFIADSLKMLLLTLWYFSIIFFMLAFLIVLVHDIVKMLDLGTKRVDKKTKELRRWKVVCLLSNKIWTRTSTKNKLKRLFFYVIWIFCVIIDGTYNYIIISLEFMIMIVLGAFCMPVLGIVKSMKWGCAFFKKNPGRTLKIIARITTISSLFIVYLIDRYEQIFSSSGSELFEFICSVIIIPILITQIMELRGRTKQGEEQ